MKKTKDIWRKCISWTGWKQVFLPHPAFTLLLTVCSMSALIWVFLNGMENTAAGYLLYPVCFYALVIFLILLSRGIPWIRKKAEQDRVFQWLRRIGGGGAFDIWFYAEQLVNFCYGGFKTVSGILLQSAWIGADGIYNFTQGAIQLYQILRHKNTADKFSQWKVYRQCGWMMIFVNLTMTGMVFQMIHMGRHEDNTQIAIIASAAFTFYKLTAAFVDMAKDRKHKNPVDSAVRFLEFGQALYNLFVLQVGLLWTFGAEAPDRNYLMNSLTGGAVCILVCGCGVYMLWRAKRDMKALKQETSEQGDA